MATEVVSSSRSAKLGETQRKDAWWIGPLLTAFGFGGFIVYSTFRAFWNDGYHLGHGTGLFEDKAYLLSPFYSPLIVMPESLSFISPAFLILWAPGGFRLTCYYYRKAYYRTFFMDPPGCAVGEGRKKYSGETRLFLFQNLHRYFLYVALIFLILLSIDVVHSCLWPTADGGTTLGVSVGTLVLLANTTLLTLYTFSCHSLRHLVGGKVDCYSCVAFGDMRHKAWKGVSMLNKKHMLFAWASLFGVGLTDFYVWMVATGRVTDFEIFVLR